MARCTSNDAVRWPDVPVRASTTGRRACSPGRAGRAGRRDRVTVESDGAAVVVAAPSGGARSAVNGTAQTGTLVPHDGGRWPGARDGCLRVRCRSGNREETEYVPGLGYLGR